VQEAQIGKNVADIMCCD